MKVTFYSNFLNDHQIPFCNKMYEILGDNFKFVATEKISDERLDLGFRDKSRDYTYSINIYEDDESEKLALQLGSDSDVVIIGSAPEKYVHSRLINKKLTFRYFERILKKGQWRIISPRAIKYLYSDHTKYRHNNLYMLCASAYAPIDFALAGAYIGKTFKWGYFPEFKKHNLNELFSNKYKNEVEILWVGRFISWKHPEKAINIAERLKKDNLKFKLKFIGNGELEIKLKSLVNQKNLTDCVEFLGSMPPENVRVHMEKANIFLFTSDYNEGWGAVLNEAMNSGCAVVASHAIGSVPFLIKHEHNGLVYKNSNITDLYNKVKLLTKQPKLCEKLGKNAYYTLERTWNADNAGNNLIKLFSSMIEGKEFDIKDGPCSKAKIIPQHKMYNYLINKFFN